MKRSEMVKIIADHISDIDYTGSFATEVFDEAGYILGLLEKAGMLPPKVITLDLGDCHRFECKWEKEE